MSDFCVPPLTEKGRSGVLVAFAARPGFGSEGGVGWAFLVQASRLASAKGIDLHCIIDARDEREVSSALTESGLSVILHAVPVPRALGKRTRLGKTRLGYMCWRIPAGRLVKKLSQKHRPSFIHQVTFATAALPPLVTRRLAPTQVWGPVTLPPGTGLMGRMARRSAKWWARNYDLVIANNSQSELFVRGWGRPAHVLEPNVVVEAGSAATAKARTGIVLAGILEPRKRPMLAIQTLAHPRLDDATLVVVGDGSLRESMIDEAARLGVLGRVRFCGRLSRAEALAEIGSASILIHPSAREGSPWVVGEAAALGTIPVVVAGSGAEATALLSGVGAQVAPVGTPESLSIAVRIALDAPRPEPSSRWSSSRLPGLLAEWWKI